MSELKCCPFCGGEDIVYSVKTAGRWERKYHVAMYCKDCNCYGKRVLITPTENTRYDVEHNEEYKKLAINSWNTRTPMANIVEKLEEKTEFLKDCTKYGNENAEQQEKSYSTMMIYEVADLVDDLIDIVKQEINNGLE